MLVRIEYDQIRGDEVHSVAEAEDGIEARLETPAGFVTALSSVGKRRRGGILGRLVGAQEAKVVQTQFPDDLVPVVTQVKTGEGEQHIRDGEIKKRENEEVDARTILWGYAHVIYTSHSRLSPPETHQKMYTECT